MTWVALQGGASWQVLGVWLPKSSGGSMFSTARCGALNDCRTRTVGEPINRWIGRSQPSAAIRAHDAADSAKTEHLRKFYYAVRNR